MKKTSEVSGRLVLTSIMVVVSLMLMGCEVVACAEELLPGASDTAKKNLEAELTQAVEEAEKEAEASTDDRSWEEVADFTLAEGQVLNVRLVYEATGAEHDSNERYTVHIENPRNNWYDTIDHWGVSRIPPSNTTDFPFGSENFNIQITQTEYYDPADVNGDYKLTIDGDSGYSHEQTLNWKDGGWTNTSGALVFNVP